MSTQKQLVKKDLLDEIKDLDKLIEKSQDNSELFKERGDRKSSIEDFEGALNDYNNAITINPNCDNYYNSRGIVFLHLKKIDDALEDFKAAININPNSSTYYSNRAFTYGELGRFENASTDIKSPRIVPAYKLFLGARVSGGFVRWQSLCLCKVPNCCVG